MWFGCSYPVRQGPPADRADKLVGVVVFALLVQNALHRVELEGQQRLGQTLIVQVQRVVLAPWGTEQRTLQQTGLFSLPGER